MGRFAGRAFVPGGSGGSSESGEEVITIVESSLTLTSGTGSHAANDVFGGVLTFANVFTAGGTYGEIVQVTVKDKIGIMPGLDLMLFTEAPSAVADDATWTISASDVAKSQGTIPFFASEWVDSAVGSVATKNVSHVVTSTSTSLIAYLVVRGIAYDPTGTDDLAITLRVRQY